PGSTTRRTPARSCRRSPAASTRPRVSVSKRPSPGTPLAFQARGGPCHPQREGTMAEIIRRGQENRPATTTHREFDPFRWARGLFRFDPFREMFPTVPGEWAQRFVPDFEVKETKDAFLFRADTPGVKEGDLEITLTGNRLTISGKREMEDVKEEDTFY